MASTRHGARRRALVGHTLCVISVPVTTPRLRIRMMRTGDMEVFIGYRNHPEVARIQDWELPYTAEMAERLIQGQSELDGPTEGDWVQMAVERGDEVVGDVAVGIHDSGRQATIDPSNGASRRVLDKLGFRYEGRSPSSVFVRGEWTDDDRYALLASEHAARVTPIVERS
jgi:RimJ/RimL family protein N-acetyltransferase